MSTMRRPVIPSIGWPAILIGLLVLLVAATSAVEQTGDSAPAKLAVTAGVWAFWLSTADSPRQDDGWVIAPMQQACETIRDHMAALATQAGVRVRISTCREMTSGELELRRHQPPDDLPPLLVTF